MNAVLHPRFAAHALAEALADAPVVLIHGPRQSGKTTLALGIAESRGYKTADKAEIEKDWPGSSRASRPRAWTPRSRPRLPTCVPGWRATP